MTTTLVNRDTGEVTEVRERFDFAGYLTGLTGAGLARQQGLAAAYDHAVRALIGPNDVQKEGGREFKKKSAWRKLARHFGISTAVVREDITTHGEEVLAHCTVRASAPWGQSVEAVGACGTDEESGQRKITMADAVATAQTRATNRAISDLVAMGEVSADELSNKRPGPRNDSVMPFGKDKGKSIASLPPDQLRSAIDWAVSKNKFSEFVEVARAELVRRTSGAKADAPGSFDDFPEALESDEPPFPAA